MFTITENRSRDKLYQWEQETENERFNDDSEVLSLIQQLDSIDEAGIDANHMIPQTDEDEFVFI